MWLEIKILSEYLVDKSQIVKGLLKAYYSLPPQQGVPGPEYISKLTDN